MDAIDLFSGCGGMTEGLRQAGFRVRAAIDVDAVAVETYRMNHPDVELLHYDIETVVASVLAHRLNLRRGDLDLLTGCPPCQGYSAIRTFNRGRAVSDPRNNLIHSLMRFVRAFEPKVVMMENVPGLMSDRRFRKTVGHLSAMGYECNFKVLNVADYGVPQRRKRLILIASRLGAIAPAPMDGVWQTVRGAIENLLPPGNTGDPLHDMPENRSAAVMAKIRQIPPDGGGRGDLPADMQLPCHTRAAGFRDIYGRLWWDRVSSTITGGCVNPSKGRFLHPVQHRAITLREAALLQTFPADYRFSTRCGKYKVAEMIGNALPPEFIRRHALAIHERLMEV